MPGLDPQSDFLHTDYFNSSPAGAEVPQLARPRTPKNPIPEINDLFQVQRNLVAAINADGDAKELHVENAYRTLRSWLKRHG